MAACARAIVAEVSPCADVHRMLPEEAEGVSRLMHEVYGDTYPKKFVYDPVQVTRKAARGEILPVTATSPAGEVIGFAAITTYPGYPRIGLVGSLAVSPSSRARGLGGMILRTLLAQSSGQGFTSLTGGAFTTHPYSQRAIERLGFVPTAILPGSQPATISFQEIAEKPVQRETTVFYTRMTAPLVYGPQFLPEQHCAVIRDICQNLGIQVRVSRDGRAGQEPAFVECSLNEETGAGMIWMRSSGPGQQEVLADAMSHLRSRGAAVLRLHIDARDPGTHAAVQVAEAAGFFFAGLLPDKDGLVLLFEHLLGTRINPGLIRMGSPAGERLLATILSYPRVRGQPGLLP
ncbi:MAG: GNAT family N-acetyltransferase [Methanomicrobiales archaeon]|nr:GNAT family N-acetyltransferase [Methanomicrobiales archaeon]